MICQWDQVPLVVPVAVVMEMFGHTSHDAVKAAIKRGDIPQPITVRPMRWSKAHLMAHLGATSRPVPMRRLA